MCSSSLKLKDAFKLLQQNAVVLTSAIIVSLLSVLFPATLQQKCNFIEPDLQISITPTLPHYLGDKQ